MERKTIRDDIMIYEWIKEGDNFEFIRQWLHSRIDKCGEITMELENDFLHININKTDGKNLTISINSDDWISTSRNLALDQKNFKRVIMIEIRNKKIDDILK
jgi:hypothetical protein